MKRVKTAFIIVLLFSIITQAHTPEVLNYQGVLKNPDGSIRPQESATITLQFIQNNSVTYSETHSITTNSNGYFSMYPGKGNALSGRFEEIDWSITPIIMRTILDNETITESYLTSVPYALYAQRFKGQEQINWQIDSLGEVLLNTGIQVDNNIVQIERMQHTGDSIGTSAPFYNATANNPLSAGNYHTATTAQASVPQALRRTGLVVTYRRDTISWGSVQFIASDTAQWHNPNSWHNYGHYGNVTLTFYKSDSLTRLQVPHEYRRQGLIISYYKDGRIKNEQYGALETDDATWSNSNSWYKLILNESDFAKMQSELARIDTLANRVKKELADMSTFGAWFYEECNEHFTQAGGLNRSGEEVKNIDMVHTQLIPLGDTWYITAYGNNEYPAISFYEENDYKSRVTSPLDTISSESWQEQTFDFATDVIPTSAKYFAVNMVLEHQAGTKLNIRHVINDVIDTSSKYSFGEPQNVFNYIGAYVGISGKQVIKSNFRHSRFMPLDDNIYKVHAYGTYNEQHTVPVIVYYSDALFSKAVGYDIGAVGEDRTTSREIVVSRETAPAEAQYFVVNKIAGHDDITIAKGASLENSIKSGNSRLESLEKNLSCYADRKMVTIGDSYTTNSGNKGTHWQEWLSQWLGVVWSKEETQEGLYNYSPMGVGGAWILPNDHNSISIRCRDVKQYSPNIIILYGGQNDKMHLYPLGTIDDEPFIISQYIDMKSDLGINSIETAIAELQNKGIPHKSNTVININTSQRTKLFCIKDAEQWENTTAWFNPLDSITFYSAYKGIVETLCTQNPYATIFCLTLMQCDFSRYDSTPEEWNELQMWSKAKCEAIKEIAHYYGVQAIDLWNKSGVTPYNAPSLYHDWIHPNSSGYRRLAECIYQHLK